MSLGSALKFLQATPVTTTTTGGSSSSNNNGNNTGFLNDAPSLHVAIQGCGHGMLDRIYSECLAHEQTTGRKIDLLLCCGDFQAHRNDDDMQTMAAPPKYRTMGDFHKYFTGQAKAPVLTVFCGGNHENSNLLFETYHGGFVAENIYYIGHSGVINVGGLRIGGLSGIFNHSDYDDNVAPYPVPPYNRREDLIRTAYHVRKFEVEKLHDFGRRSEAAGLPPLDIFISHDWPVGVTDHGNVDELLRVKPYFKDDIERRRLGNPHTMALLRALRPARWFAAHLHCRFRALVPHSGSNNNNSSHTDFLALSKCVTRTTEFMEFRDITPRSETLQGLGIKTIAELRDPFTKGLNVFVDPVWCDVIRATHARIPLALSNGNDNSAVLRNEIEWVRSVVGQKAMEAAAASKSARTARRRERAVANDEEDGEDDEESTSTSTLKPVPASDTIGLLFALDLLDGEQAIPEERQQEKPRQQERQRENVPAPFTFTDDIGDTILDDDDEGCACVANDDDDDEYAPPAAANPNKQQQSKSKTAAAAAAVTAVIGGVLQQDKTKTGDAGFGWSEDV